MPINALACLLRAKDLTVRVCFKFPGSPLRLSVETAPVRTTPLVQTTASVEGESERTGIFLDILFILIEEASQLNICAF